MFFKLPRGFFYKDVGVLSDSGRNSDDSDGIPVNRKNSENSVLSLRFNANEMFETYQEAVFAFYRKQVEIGLLSHLDQPSPGVLRSECVNANRNRPLSNETVSLKTFFGLINDDVNAIDRLVESFDLDRLRPLRNFMIRDTQAPQRVIVELLAWLINYEHRPYYSGWGGNGGGIKPIGEKLKIWQHPTLIIGYIILTLMLFGYLVWQFNFSTASSNPKPNEKCMYWTGSHFEPLDCKAPAKYEIVEPLDVQRLNGFKKILFGDLLTKKDIGKVYLLNGVDGPEYFTQNGIYPENPTKKLRPLSPYMLAKYTSFYRFLLWCSVAVILTIIIVIAIVKMVYRFTKESKY